METKPPEIVLRGPDKRLIDWRKPTLVGEAPRLGASAIQMMTDHEVRRFWSRIIAFAALTPFGLFAAQAIDGHWWKGNLGGSAAAILAVLLFSVFTALGWSIGRIYRDAAARAQAVNARHAIFESSSTALRSDIGLWKLTGLIGALSFIIAVAIPPYVDFLYGVPQASHRHFRLRSLLDLVEPYVPHGPVAGGAILALLLMADLFLVFLFFKEIRRRLHL